MKYTTLSAFVNSLFNPISEKSGLFLRLPFLKEAVLRYIIDVKKGKPRRRDEGFVSARRARFVSETAIYGSNFIPLGSGTLSA